MGVSISRGNSKMGEIRSVSLPAIVTCDGLPCSKKCYAYRIERRRPSVHKAYQNNLDILNNDPDTYWREVEAAIMMSRFFRFHVSGDIPDQTYAIRMIQTAKRNPHCQILCFTKKYELINKLLSVGWTIPCNLHIIFSAWKNVDMNNAHKLPEAHVKYKDGSTTARDDAFLCKGNCASCAMAGEGCWVLKSGQQIVFNEH